MGKKHNLKSFIYQNFIFLTGRVLHAHDFRDAREFTGKRLLLVGSSYSAEDIGLQCIKYGAESVICSYRSSPMGFKWPANFTERPILTKVEGKTAFFKDGTTAEVDAIIMCTGYKHHYPYLEDSLRLTGPNILVLDDLYKGVVWLKGGNNKFLYVGAQDQYYTFTMFDMQALWVMKYVTGQIALPDPDLMDGNIKEWKEKYEKDFCLNHP